MKKFWVKVIPWNKEIVTTALESGADAVWVEEGMSEKVKQLGRITTIAPDGDMKINQDVVYIKIESKNDEKEALRLSKSKTVILSTPDWSIIPLENLIAQSEGLIAEVDSFEKAKTALQILEKGVDGILLTTTNLNELKKTANLIKSISEKIDLVPANIISTKVLGMGDRVCIDTCTNMKLGEGMLIGNSSGAMFLVHSETVENPYVETRPFRVNAGGIHAYTLLPEGKTKYLSEIKSGDEVLIVDSHRREDKDVIMPADREAALDMLKKQIERVLETLPKREKDILKLRFGIGRGVSPHTYTLKEIGKKFNITAERVRQIEAEALNKLRHPAKSQVAIVGRVKVEKRPMMLVEAEAEKGRISLILQNAETVNLTQPDSSPISVVSLLKGSEVLAYIGDTGRHFGMKIEETIEEK